VGVLIREKKVKCNECKSFLQATAKIDAKTSNVLKYLKINGGDRREFPNRYKATYCFKCISKLEQAAKPNDVQSAREKYLETYYARIIDERKREIWLKEEHEEDHILVNREYLSDDLEDN
jgi:hypothetical protein